MMKCKGQWGWAALSVAVLAAGCGSAVDVSDETDGASSSSSSDTDPSTTAPPTTGATQSTSAGTLPPMSTSATSGPVDTTDGDSTGNDDSSFITPDTGNDDGPIVPQPNGAQCDVNDGCDSGFCYAIPQFGGVCSECLVDQDCESGTCSLDAASGFAVCTDGSAGVQCNTDEGCMDELVCTELIDTGGIFNASFCSECKTDKDCGDDLCAPFYDLGNLGGTFNCVTPGTVENGQGCPIDGAEGVDAACASGHCGIANLFGFAELGVCGECSVDDDCLEEGQTCAPPEAGQNGLSGASCQ